MKQTVVEWLKKELESYGDPQFCKIEWEQLDSLIQQALEMEKEQMKLACIRTEYENKAWQNLMEKQFEQYYNETYKNTEQ